MKIMVEISYDQDIVVLDKMDEDTIVKGLRLLLLVGNDEETMTAAKLLYLLSQEKHSV